MFTVMAMKAVVKKNDSTPCATTIRRIDFCVDRDVRDLERHADDEGEIDEVPVVRLVILGKLQAAHAAAAVVVVGVVQGEDGVDEDPGQHDGADRERAIDSVVRTRSITASWAKIAPMLAIDAATVRIRMA